MYKCCWDLIKFALFLINFATFVSASLPIKDPGGVRVKVTSL